MTASENSFRQQRATLVILLATCERALEAFQVADNVVDEEFVADLERVIGRTRRELEVLQAQIGGEPGGSGSAD